GERAAEEEADEVVAPPGPQCGRLLDQLTIAPDSIARQVIAQVGSGGDETWFSGTRFGDVEQGTRFGIALAEEEEVKSQVARHDDEVGLDEAEGQARSRACQVTVARSAANLRALHLSQIHELVSQEGRASGITATGSRSRSGPRAYSWRPPGF